MKNKFTFVFIALVILLAFVLLVSRAGATEERTLWQQVTELELTVQRLEQRIAALEACNPIACNAPALSPPGAVQGILVTVVQSETTTLTATVVPPVVTTPAPTLPPPPTSTPQPSATPTDKPKCNQGVGNGPEGCDPGNSNHNQPSNDEGPHNRGGNPKP